MIPRTAQLQCAVLLLAYGAAAQPAFIKAWDWSGNSRGYTVHQLGDGGYMVGASIAETTDRIASALIRTDSLGDTLWTCILHYQGKGFACQTSDQDFVLVTDTIDAQRGLLYVAATKVDQQGGVKWSHFYPPCGDLPRSVWPTADGGVVVCGTFTDGAAHGAGIKKLDESGNQQWESVLHSENDTAYSSGYSVQQTPDGGYIVAGRLIESDHDRFFLARTDSLGDTVWTRSDMARSECSSVSLTADGGFVTTGSEHDSVRQRSSVYLAKYDPFGTLVWHRSYGSGTGGYWGYCVRQVRDGGFVVVGAYEATTGHGRSAMVLRTDFEGDSLWLREYVYPSGFLNIFLWLEQTADGGYVMTGEVDYTLVLLVKTDSLGLVHGGGVEEKHVGGMMRPMVQTVSVACEMLTYRSPASGSQPVAELVDIAGRRTMELKPGENDVRHLAPGVYFVRTAEGGGRTAVSKVTIPR